MQKYHIVSKNTVEEIERAVQDYLNRGYNLLGELHVTPVRVDKTMQNRLDNGARYTYSYTQAVVKNA